MVKLQEIKRANGSVVNHITLPKEVVEELGWSKGDSIEATVANIKGIGIPRLILERV